MSRTSVSVLVIFLILLGALAFSVYMAEEARVLKEEKIFQCQKNGYADIVWINGQIFCYGLHGDRGELIRLEKLQQAGEIK